MKRYKIIEPVTKPRFATVSPVRVLPNPKLGPIRPVGTPAIHDPPRGTDFVPDRRPGVPDPAPGTISPVLVYGQLVAETNTFSDPAMPMVSRLASAVGVTTPLKVPAVPLRMPDHVAVPVAWIEATEPMGTRPRIAVRSLRFDSPSSVRVGEQLYARGPLAKPPRAITGTQATAVMTAAGPRMLAAYTVEHTIGTREVWVVDISPSGEPMVSVVVRDGGADTRVEWAGPAVAAADGADAFLAWATSERDAPGVRAGRLVSTSPGRWRLATTNGGAWPVVYPMRDTGPARFAYDLCASYDAEYREFVVAAVQASYRPFLARYDGDGNRLRVPQAIGLCGEEDAHGNVQFLIHPETHRAILKVHHNYHYLERGAGGQFVRIRRGGEPRGPGDCNIADPFEDTEFLLPAVGEPFVQSLSELTSAAIAVWPGAEFCVAGEMARTDPAPIAQPQGGLVANLIAPMAGTPFRVVSGLFPDPRLASVAVLTNLAVRGLGIQLVLTQIKPESRVSRVPLLLGVAR